MTGPLPLDQPHLVRRLRDMLVAVSFTGEKDRLCSSGIPVQVRQLAPYGTFGALVRLLILNLDVPAAELTPAITPLTLDVLR